MRIRDNISEIDGAKHRENLRFLQAAKVATDAASFKSNLFEFIGTNDICNMIAAGPANSKTFVVRDYEALHMLVVSSGADGSTQTNAIIEAFRLAPEPSGRAAEPYNTGALTVLPFTSPNPDPAWNKITLIGHSYGGALALALASRFYLTWPDCRTFCYTYGSPKYGRSDLGNFWRGHPVINVYNWNDPIPDLPPKFADDPVFYVYVAGGLSSFGGVLQGNMEKFSAPMCNYQLRDSRLILSSGTNLVFQGHPLPITAWLISNDYFGAVAHSLDGYQAAMGNVPAVELPSIQPQAIPTVSVNAPRLTAPQQERVVRQALQSAGLTTATDVSVAVTQTQAAIINQRGTFYKRTRFRKVPTVSYAGEIVLVCKGIRDQKKIVKQLNKSLRGQ